MVKHAKTIRRLLPMICVSVFDHFMGFALKGLKYRIWLQINVKATYFRNGSAFLGIGIILKY